MRTLSSHVPTAARVLLGSVFLVFGLNGFLNFMALPEHPAPAQAFLGALAATGYMFPLIKATEVAVGLGLLLNRFVPLALVVLMPVTVNIMLFHAAFEPASLAMPLVLLALQLYLAWTQRQSYRPLLRAQVDHAGSVEMTAQSHPAAT